MSDSPTKPLLQPAFAAAPTPSARRIGLGASWPLWLALFCLAATAWLRPFAIPDEGRYSGVAWAMLTGGDWLVPHINGLPYFHKPPLFYWISASAMGLFGPVEWAARIAPWLGASAATAAVYLFARRWRDEAFARRTLMALCSQVLLFMGAQFANLDMLVAGCITVTVLSLAHVALAREEGGDARGVLALAYLFAALGVLAKGLIGLVLPGMVIVAWLALRGRWRILFSLVWWPGVLLFLAVAGPWFVLMQQRFPAFSHYFFYVQHFARYAQGGFNNPQPPYFYPVVLLVLACPWSLWVLAGLRRRPRGDALWLLAWSWLLLLTLFFSLPQSKLVGYILPVTAPMALLAAQAWSSGRRATLAWRASAAVAAVACLAAVTVSTVHPVRSSRSLGLALRQAGAADQVVFLRNFWFDVPVYARLAHPVRVIDDWDSPALRGRDNWRKELTDAAAFDEALGRELLVSASDAAKVLCTPAATWVVGDPGAASNLKMLAGAREVARNGNTLLWLLPATVAGASRAGCP